ncbi:hypothetical protein ACKWTF_016374 [Chironomus riparius]
MNLSLIYGLISSIIVVVMASDQQKIHDSICMNDFIELQRENSSILRTWSTFTSSHKYGNSHDFGDFFGCNSINNTQYCLVQYFQDSNPPISVLPSISYYQKLWTDLDKSFLGALCLPSSCGLRDVREILQKINQGQNLTFSDKIFCKTRKSEKFGIKLNKNNFSFLNWWNFERICICSLIVILAVTFSMLNIETHKTVNIVKDLFTSSQAESPTAYLNGVKANTIISITFYHSYLSKVTMPFKSGDNLQKYTNEVLYESFGMLAVIMDVFFIIGGFLTAKSLKKGLNAPNKVNWIAKFYIKRVMRLLPVTYFVVILLVTSSTDSLAPYDVGMNVEAKQKLWMLPFLYNFMGYVNTVETFIWFIAVFLQLIILSPFVLILTRMEKYGNKIAIILMTFCGIARYFHTSDYYYGQILSTSNTDMFTDDRILQKYTAAQLRFYSFFGGLIVERFFNEKSTEFMSKFKIASASAAIISLILIITGAKMLIPELISVADVVLVSVFISICYFCYHSNWKIKKYYSMKIWTIISKMGLSIYLMTGYVVFTIHERQVEPLEIENLLDFLLVFIKDVLKITIAVLPTYILVEEPISRLGDYIANKISFNFKIY